jgi:hypothetical protein
MNHYAKNLIRHAQRRAKRKGIPFTLVESDIQAVIDGGVCQATGISFNLEEGVNWNGPSIDRINPSDGYTKENTRVVIQALNCMLGNWGPEIMQQVFLAWKERN